MLWISSLISTVLPTPAPPIRPILKPLWIGAKKSIILIPVHKGVSSISSLSRGIVCLLLTTLLTLLNGFPSIMIPYESLI